MSVRMALRCSQGIVASVCLGSYAGQQDDSVDCKCPVIKGGMAVTDSLLFPLESWATGKPLTFLH